MIKKVYIWNDIPLVKKDINIAKIQENLKEIKQVLKDQIEILDNIEKEYKIIVNNLKNIVTIGTRPNMFLNKTKKKYNIVSKRIIGKEGFADDCILNVDEKIYRLKNINIVEDIIVSGTTMTKILEDLYKNNSNMKINVYFLIGYESAIEDLKEKFPNLNVYCFNVLEEKSVKESTCMFLSDILYEKLGNKTYISHIQNLNLFGEKTEYFISKMKEIKEEAKLKVGIVTITVGINYGNRLQNYALQKVLNNLGIDVTTFENIYQENTLGKRIKRYRVLKKKNKIFRLKLKKFKVFDEKYIKFGETIKSYSIPKNLANKYDYFICGSDQIWNPYFDGNTGTNFATFAPKQKRVAYAPSFGVETIPQIKREEYKEYLEGMNNLSCREIQGVKLIKDLTGMDAKLVLDPTLLLDKNEWKKIAKYTKYTPKKDYIVTYFLGKVEKEYEEYIKSIAVKNGLEIFNIMDMTNMDSFSTDSSEFIYLIKNARLVCTDSFHGTVFSIIFNKPYVLFERKSNMQNMNSRFESLKEMIGLPERNYTNLEEKDIFNLKYDVINKNIEKKKQESIEYLKDSLNIWE